MPTPVQCLEGTIINRVEAGESHLRIFFFSGQKGLQVILFRMSKKFGSLPPPDLFDDVEFVANVSKDGTGLPFVKNFQIIQKRPGLAHDHSRFHIASTIARLYLDNGSHLQDTIPFGQLLLRSLSALHDGFDPPCVLFKTLFQFGRLEGLPVKQDWLINLDHKEKAEAIFRLNTKLAVQEPNKDLVMNLVNSLQGWLNSETELRC
ncbi:MAG: hypothetical protein HN548_01835 [Opitutae bacterium]|jgi:hypothetical protein|nr:hypothetical protein [Opitutae bacterium]MBT5716588.1 hypothetical protein [Opitutae bacterium]